MSGDWLGLTGRVCAVTGAGGGIGRAIAEALAAVGARVAVIDRNPAGAEETTAAIRLAGGEALAVSCDVAEAASVTAALEATEAAFGPCRVLVNNAALLRPGALADLSLKDWNDLIGVNLTGYFLCAQAFGRRMREAGGGSLVHVASLSGSLPQPFGGAYSVSKAGVAMLSKNLATEWGEQGIRSNVVSPAMVVTPLTEVIYRDPAIKAQREAVVPLRRIGTGADIADAVTFLASDRAGYITGQEITVDGGWSQNMLAMVPRPGFDKAAAKG